MGFLVLRLLLCGLSRLTRFLEGFHALPFHGQAADDRGGRTRHADFHGVGEGGVVRDQHLGQVSSGDDIAQVGRARADDHGGGNLGNGAEGCAEFLDEGLREDVLPDGDEDGAAEALEEEHDGYAYHDILLGKTSLGCHAGLLHSESETEAV